MSLSRVVFTDRTGILGASGSMLAGLPPESAASYLFLRLLIPVLLLVLAGRGATPTQRIGLVRDYLLGASVPGTIDSPDPASTPQSAGTGPTGDPEELMGVAGIGATSIVQAAAPLSKQRADHNDR